MPCLARRATVSGSSGVAVEARVGGPGPRRAGGDRALREGRRVVDVRGRVALQAGGRERAPQAAVTRELDRGRAEHEDGPDGQRHRTQDSDRTAHDPEGARRRSAGPTSLRHPPHGAPTARTPDLAPVDHRKRPQLGDAPLGHAIEGVARQRDGPTESCAERDDRRDDGRGPSMSRRYGERDRARRGGHPSPDLGRMAYRQGPRITSPRTRCAQAESSRSRHSASGV